GGGGAGDRLRIDVALALQPEPAPGQLRTERVQLGATLDRHQPARRIDADDLLQAGHVDHHSVRACTVGERGSSAHGSHAFAAPRAARNHVDQLGLRGWPHDRRWGAELLACPIAPSRAHRTNSRTTDSATVTACITVW